MLKKELFTESPPHHNTVRLFCSKCVCNNGFILVSFCFRFRFTNEHCSVYIPLNIGLNLARWTAGYPQGYFQEEDCWKKGDVCFIHTPVERHRRPWIIGTRITRQLLSSSAQTQVRPISQTAKTDDLFIDGIIPTKAKPQDTVEWDRAHGFHVISRGADSQFAIFLLRIQFNSVRAECPESHTKV